MIFCNTENNQHKEQKALHMLEEQRVRGLILTPTADYSSPTEAKQLKRVLDNLKVPVVLMDRRVENPQWDGIYYDNFNGGYKATEALIQAGHKRIGTITGDLRQIHGRERFNGFKQAIFDSDFSLDPRYVYKGDFTTQAAYEITKKMIASGEMPEAIFLSNNLTSIGFVKAIFEARMELGRDICCVGFDHVDTLDILNVDFSYVERDTINIGANGHADASGPDRATYAAQKRAYYSCAFGAQRIRKEKIGLCSKNRRESASAGTGKGCRRFLKHCGR